MPDGYRLWRTADGDLVEDGHPDGQLLAYGISDNLKPEDADNVREIVEIEGVLVEDELAGTGPSVNAETGEVTQSGDPLPTIEQTGGAPLPPAEEPEAPKPGSKGDLIAQAAALGLSTDGTKAELAERLAEAKG